MSQMEKILAITVLSVFFTSLIALLVFMLWKIFGSGGINFFNNETLFDEKYLEIRKKHLSVGEHIYCPLRIVFDIPFKSYRSLHQSKNIKCEEDISNYILYKAPLFNPDCLSIILYTIIDDIRDPNNPISQKFFEPMPTRIDYWQGKEGYDIRTIVKNILSVVPTKEQLTSNEFVQFKYLLYEILLNGIMKNPNNYKELMKILKENIGGDLSGLVLTDLIYPNGLEHTKFLLESLSSQLQLKVKVYDYIFKGNEISIPITTYSPENPLKELRFLNLGDNLCYLKPPQ